MKLKFEIQEFQNIAVNSIVDIFKGVEVKKNEFTIDKSKEIKPSLDIQTLGYGNNFNLDYALLMSNIRNIQMNNRIGLSKHLSSDLNFTIEMETGTGKTYVYIRTILELNKQYGFTKFIIVVPSIAIKEGTLKSLEITKEHFSEQYDNVNYRFFTYDSNNLNQIFEFANNTNIEIMVINIDSFKKSFEDIEKESKANIIHRPSDALSGNKPIDLIKSVRPIVIVDEPQSISSEKSKVALKSLEPLITVGYSATHKEKINLVYQLTPIDAFNFNIVKKIQVSSISMGQSTTTPYFYLISVKNNPALANLEIFYKLKNGSITKKQVKAKVGDDIWDLSNKVEVYENKNFVITDIDTSQVDGSINLFDGSTIKVGERIGQYNDEDIKRAQIRETIKMHLTAERDNFKRNVKVLSLIFLDKVENYRQYDPEGNEIKGKYATWFEEDFKELINLPTFNVVKEKYKELGIPIESAKLHNGYFSIDKKKKLKDTTGESADDESTYDLIMKDKEKLLSYAEPVRFIFSHSALKEGWDNPNIFQVCTLVETKDNMTKRQKIGRGLRIPVDQNGVRSFDPLLNVLTVVANESYKDFAEGLQKEYEESGYEFGKVTITTIAGITYDTSFEGPTMKINYEEAEKIIQFLKNNNYLNSNSFLTEKIENKAIDFKLPGELEKFSYVVYEQLMRVGRKIPVRPTTERKKVNLNKKLYLSQEFIDLWNKIKQKTKYSINIDSKELINKASAHLRDEFSGDDKIKPEKVLIERTKLILAKEGVTYSDPKVGSDEKIFKNAYPDIVKRLQETTGLTRKTIIDILKGSKFEDFKINQEEYINRVRNTIVNYKLDQIKNGIKYEKIDEYYKMEEIFSDEDLFVLAEYLLETKSNKHLFDHLIFDSGVEKSFAEKAEADEDVLLYTKLPPKFQIDTPFGNYNPDWAMLIKQDGSEKVYFVVETKGELSEEDLAWKLPEQYRKVLAGKRHFAALNNGVTYKVVKHLSQIKRNLKT